VRSGCVSRAAARKQDKGLRCLGIVGLVWCCVTAGNSLEQVCSIAKKLVRWDGSDVARERAVTLFGMNGRGENVIMG
jgi:hypothetical protein